MRDFVYGGYITDEVISCSGNCDPRARADTANSTAVSEMLRQPIHQALQTWAEVTRLIAVAAKPSNGNLKPKAVLQTTYGGKAVAGMTIAFSVGKHKLCNAKTTSTGTATCSGKFTGSPKNYTAKFAGAGGFFSAVGTGRVLA